MLRFTDYGQEGIYICTGSQALYLLLAGKRIGSDTLTAPCKVEEDTCALQFLFSSSAKGDDIYEPGGTHSIRFSRKSVWFLHSCERLSCLLLCCSSEALYQRQQTSPFSQFYTGSWSLHWSRCIAVEPWWISLMTELSPLEGGAKVLEAKPLEGKFNVFPQVNFCSVISHLLIEPLWGAQQFTHGRAPEAWDKQKGILLQVELGPV